MLYPHRAKMHFVREFFAIGEVFVILGVPFHLIEGCVSHIVVSVLEAIKEVLARVTKASIVALGYPFPLSSGRIAL